MSVRRDRSFHEQEYFGSPESNHAHRDPHVEVRPYYTEQRSESTPISAGLGDRTDIPGYAESLNLRSHDNGRMRGVGHIVELLPDPRSDRLPSQLAGRRSDEKAKPVTGPDKAAPAQKRAYKRESDGLQDSTVVGVGFRARV